MTAMTSGSVRQGEPVIERASPSDRAFLAMDSGEVPEQFGVILMLDNAGGLDLARTRGLIAERVQAVPAAATAGSGAAGLRRPDLGRRPGVRYRAPCPRGGLPQAGRRTGAAGHRPVRGHAPAAADRAVVVGGADRRSCREQPRPGDRAAPHARRWGGSLVLEQKMLRGIKARAERLAATASWPTTGSL
jgi:hypothetical protein